MKILRVGGDSPKPWRRILAVGLLSKLRDARTEPNRPNVFRPLLVQKVDGFQLFGELRQFTLIGVVLLSRSMSYRMGAKFRSVVRSRLPRSEWNRKRQISAPEHRRSSRFLDRPL